MNEERNLADILTELDSVGRYSTVLIDPPWPMKKAFIDADSRANQKARGDDRLDYPTMTLTKIRNLPISDLANQDSHLWTWATQRFLPNALEFIKYWGFNYHCTLTWVKPGGPVPQSFCFNSEFLVFAYKGRFQLNQMGIKTTFDFPPTAHSAKPHYQYELIEKVSFPRYLELFAREKEPGWDVWGNQVNSDLQL